MVQPTYHASKPTAAPSHKLLDPCHATSEHFGPSHVFSETCCSVINTGGVRLWLYSQPGSPPPCSATAGSGRPSEAACTPARTAAAAQQQQQQPRGDASLEYEDSSLDDMPAADGETAGGEQLLPAGDEEVSKADDGQEGGEQPEQQADQRAAELAAEEEEEEAEEERWARAEEQAAAQEVAAKAAREEAELEEEESQLEAAEVEQGMQHGSQQQQPAGQQAEQGTAPAQQAPAGQEATAQEAKQPAAGPSPYQQALSQCEDLQCLAVAAQQERHPGQFLFPHFFIVGWQASRAGVGSNTPAGGRFTDGCPVCHELCRRPASAQSLPLCCRLGWAPAKRPHLTARWRPASWQTLCALPVPS